ncbi:uncharacterized protein LOC120431740 [Culex pipiens pallens]|uniref:uncharacterized protein LOC120431740 n=1 Tax=Culex pipiens pallens TaxID=42434 RepID=UPI001953FA20|nr:uncharacterized protein LOC120431740 [Culex pipiens pallens]
MEQKSARSLTIKRNFVKGKISRVVDRLKAFQENHQLPSFAQIQVFVWNVEKYYGEFNKVCDEFKVSDADAGERFNHDIEWARVVSLVQEANLRIVALNNALLSQPVHAAVPEQQQQPVSKEEASRTTLPTNEARGEGDGSGAGDVPDVVNAKRCQADDRDPGAPDTKVGAHSEPSSDPPIADSERGEPMCTLCNGCRSDTDCFPVRGDQVEQCQTLKRSIPDLSSRKRLPRESHETETHLAAHEMLPPEEPAVVPHESSSNDRGSAETKPGLCSPQWLPGDSREPENRQEESSEEPAVVPHESSSGERGSAESDDPAAASCQPAEHVEVEPDVDTCLAVQEGALLPTKPDEENNEEGAQCGCTEPASLSVQVDWTTNQNAMKANKNTDINEYQRTCTSHESATYRCSQRTELYYRCCRDSIARSGADCADKLGRAVEKLHDPAIFSSTTKRPRLVWDPGVELNAADRSTQP